MIALNVGQSHYDAGFMTITTKGDFSSVFGTTQRDNISLTFTFTSPSGANGIGQAGTVSQTEFLLAPTFDYASLTFAGDTNVDQNGRFARQTVTFSPTARKPTWTSMTRPSAAPRPPAPRNWTSA